MGVSLTEEGRFDRARVVHRVRGVIVRDCAGAAMSTTTRPHSHERDGSILLRADDVRVFRLRGVYPGVWNRVNGESLT